MHLKWLYIHFCSIISTFRQLHGATLWTLCCIWIVRKIACVASVSLRFRSKERPRNRILSFGRARNETRAKKWKCGEGERKEVSIPFFPTPPRSFTYAIFRAVFDSRSSFFAPKPHGNACYAGYQKNSWCHLFKIMAKWEFFTKHK